MHKIVITVRTVGLLEVAEPDLARCRELTYEGGLMRRCIDELRAENSPRAERSTILMALDEQETILGWALLFENRVGRFESYYFVDGDHRRRGIGRRLAEQVRAMKPRHKVLVRPHDGVSYSFFSNFPRFVPQGTWFRLEELKRAADALVDEQDSPVSG